MCRKATMIKLQQNILKCWRKQWSTTHTTLHPSQMPEGQGCSPSLQCRQTLLGRQDTKRKDAHSQSMYCLQEASMDGGMFLTCHNNAHLKTHNSKLHPWYKYGRRIIQHTVISRSILDQIFNLAYNHISFVLKIVAWKYPCSEYGKPVKNNEQGVQCELCMVWFHSKYLGLTTAQYLNLEGTDES